MKLAGKLILWASVALAAYAFLVFDPSVSAGTYSVINIHRLSFQQNMLILAAAGAVVGVLLLIFGTTTNTRQAEHDAVTSYTSRVEDAVDGVKNQFSEALRANDIATAKRMLSNRSISADGCNRNGRGWLQLSVATGNLENCKLLLEAGASPTAKDDIGTTALEEAEKRGQVEVLALLKRHTEQRQQPPSASSAA